MPPKEIIIVLQGEHIRGEEPTTLSSSSGHSRRPLIPRSDSYRKYRRRCHYLMERDRSTSKGSESSFSTGTDAVADVASLPVIARPESPTLEGNDNVSATTGDSPLETRHVKHHHQGLMPLGSLAGFLSKEVTKAQEKGLYYHCSVSKLNSNLLQDGPPPIVELDDFRKEKRSSSSGNLS